MSRMVGSATTDTVLAAGSELRFRLLGLSHAGHRVADHVPRVSPAHAGQPDVTGCNAVLTANVALQTIASRARLSIGYPSCPVQCVALLAALWVHCPCRDPHQLWRPFNARMRKNSRYWACISNRGAVHASIPDWRAHGRRRRDGLSIGTLPEDYDIRGGVLRSLVALRSVKLLSALEKSAPQVILNSWWVRVGDRWVLSWACAGRPLPIFAPPQVVEFLSRHARACRLILRLRGGCMA